MKQGKTKSGKLSYLFIVNLTFLILFVRSFSDLLADFGLGVIRFNLSSMTGIIFIALTVLLFFSGKIKNPSMGKIFLLWILFYLPFAILSFVNYGVGGLFGLREWIRLLSIFSVFLISYCLIRSFEDKKYLKYLFIVFFIPFSVSIYQLFTRTGVIQFGMHRIYGTVSEPNSFSLLIIVFYALTWYFLVFSNKKILWGTLIVLEELALVNTVSMTGYIMFFLINFFFFINKSIIGKRKYLLILFMAIFVLFVGYNRSYHVKFEQTMEDTLNYKEPSNSLSWRIYNWKELILLWKQNPYFGYGLSSVPTINPVRTTAGIGYDSHNDYVKYLVETGIVGLTVFLLFLFYVLMGLYKNYRAACDCKIKYLMYILLVTFFVMQVGSLSCDFIEATISQYCFWAMCGISLKLCYWDRILNRPNEMKT